MRPVVDHVPFAASDLGDAVARFERLGLPPTYGGEHGDGTTEMAIVVLPDGSYVELIAPTGAGEPGFWPDALAADAGPCAWCVDAGSVHAAMGRYIDRDVRVDGPHRASRTRPDGVTAEWDMAFLGPDGSEVMPFLIGDRTPREYRVPESQLYGAPLSGIGWVVLLVEDLAAAVEEFIRLYRLPSPVEDVDPDFGDLVRFPEQAFVLAAPTDGPLAERLDTIGPGPAALLLSGAMDDARGQYPLGAGRSWFGRRLAFFEGFENRVGVVERA